MTDFAVQGRVSLSRICFTQATVPTASIVSSRGSHWQKTDFQWLFSVTCLEGVFLNFFVLFFNLQIFITLKIFFYFSYFGVLHIVYILNAIVDKFKFVRRGYGFNVLNFDLTDRRLQCHDKTPKTFFLR